MAFYLKILSGTFIVKNYTLEPSSGLKAHFLWQQFSWWWHRSLLVSLGRSLFPKKHRNVQLHTAILETSWVTITHQANEKIPTWKQVAQAETHTCYKLHTQHSARHSRGVPSTPSCRDMAYWNLRDAAKAGKFIVINTNVKEKERTKINSLTLYLNEPDKEQTKPNITRKTGITKIRAEINEIETRKKTKKYQQN